MMSLLHHQDKTLSPSPELFEGRAESPPKERSLSLSSISSPFSFSEEKRPRSFMIHGELVALTGDLRTGAILGQLFYWSQKVTDLDLYLKEEKNVLPSSKEHVYQHGWFCKTLIALMNETMLRVSLPTMRNYLRFLIDRKWLQIRPCPQNKRGNYYRVNLKKLSEDLQKRGLSGFAIYERGSPSTQSFCALDNDSLTGRTP